MTAPIQDHRAENKPHQRGRWSWAFMRRDTYDGPGRKWTRNRFLIGTIIGLPGLPRSGAARPPLAVPLSGAARRVQRGVRAGHAHAPIVEMPRSFGQGLYRRLHTFPLAAAHRITYVELGTVTLVLVGPKLRSWGFYGDDGIWIDWREALGVRPTEGLRSTGKYPASSA